MAGIGDVGKWRCTSVVVADHQRARWHWRLGTVVHWLRRLASHLALRVHVTRLVERRTVGVMMITSARWPARSAGSGEKCCRVASRYHAVMSVASNITFVVTFGSVEPKKWSVDPLTFVLAEVRRVA